MQNLETINSLFGTFKKGYVNDQLQYDFDNAIYKDSTNDYIFRRENIDRDIKKAQQKLDVRYDPKTYLEEKNENIREAIMELLGIKFLSSFEFYLNNGFTQEEAKKKATKDVDLEYKRFMERHNVEFPYSTEQVLKNAKKKW